MAKKSKATEEGSSLPSEQLTDLERQRAERVLVSQGRAIGLLDCFPPAMQLELAGYCDAKSGAMKEGTREGVGKLIADFYAEQKADVEEEKTKPTGFGLPAAAPQPEAGQPNK